MAVPMNSLNILGLKCSNGLCAFLTLAKERKIYLYMEDLKLLLTKIQ